MWDRDISDDPFTFEEAEIDKEMVEETVEKHPFALWEEIEQRIPRIHTRDAIHYCMVWLKMHPNDDDGSLCWSSHEDDVFVNEITRFEASDSWVDISQKIGGSRSPHECFRYWRNKVSMSFLARPELKLPMLPDAPRWKDLSFEDAFEHKEQNTFRRWNPPLPRQKFWTDHMKQMLYLFVDEQKYRTDISWVQVEKEMKKSTPSLVSPFN